MVASHYYQDLRHEDFEKSVLRDAQAMCPRCFVDWVGSLDEDEDEEVVDEEDEDGAAGVLHYEDSQRDECDVSLSSQKYWKSEIT